MRSFSNAAATRKPRKSSTGGRLTQMIGQRRKHDTQHSYGATAGNMTAPRRSTRKPLHLMASTQNHCFQRHSLSGRVQTTSKPQMIFFSRALALDPGNEWGLRNYADFLMDRRGDARTALGFYRRALRKAKTPNAELVGNYGFALLMAGARPDRALRHLRHASEMDPGSLGAKINLTLSLFLAGRAESAEAELQGLLRRDDLVPHQVFELHILRAMFDSSAANREESAAYVSTRLTEALDIIPESLMQVLIRRCSSRSQRALLDTWNR